MKKIFSLILIAVFYITPLAAFSQKTRTAQQTKTGRLTINVSYSRDFTNEINKKRDPDTSTTGKMTTHFQARYQCTVSSKVIKHDGFVSDIEPVGNATTGNFNYVYSGHIEEHASDSSGNSITDEKSEFSGTIASPGECSIDTPDQGDGITAAKASAFGPGSGFSLSTIKDDHGTQTDKTCIVRGLAMDINVDDMTPDPTKPPETACAAKFENTAAVNNKMSSDVMGNSWGSVLSSSGTFEANAYNFSFKGKKMPAELNTNENGEKHTLIEELIVEGSLALSSGTVKKTVGMLPLKQTFDLALALLPSSNMKWRLINT